MNPLHPTIERTDNKMSHTNKKLGNGSPFARTMSDLCLKILFEFTTIPDRFQCCMRVCKYWYTTLHQPYLWSNVSWRGDLDFLSPDSPHSWLHPMMSGLTIVSRKQQEYFLTLVQPWTHLSHLSLLGMYHAMSPEQFTRSLLEWREVLTNLKLVSFKASGMTEACQAALFSCEPQQPPPAILRWSSTLKEFHLGFACPIEYWPFSAFVQVDSWPCLERFYFRIGLRGLKQQEAKDCLDFFSNERLPALRILSLDYHLYIHEAVNPTDVFLIQLYDAISRLRGLEETDVHLRSSEHIHQIDLTASRTHLGLNCAATLTSLSFNQALKPTEFEYVPKCSLLQELRFASDIVLRIPNVEFFEMIGAHHLPHLHTLSFSVFLGSSPMTLARHTFESPADATARLSRECLRIQDIIRGMLALETLELWYDEVKTEERELVGSWLESIHLFPSLTKFTLQFTATESPLPPDFLLSLANAPQLRVLELTTLNVSRLAQLAGYWYERHQRSAPSPPPSRGFLSDLWKRIRGGHETTHAVYHPQPEMTPSALQLSSLPIRIHTLSIIHLGLHSVPFNQPNYTHPMVEIMQHLASSLPQLSSLKLWLRMIVTQYVPTIGNMTHQAREQLAPRALKGVGAHWKEITRFQQLRTLILHEEYSVTPSVLNSWCKKGQHLQQLERLELRYDTLIGVKPTDLLTHLLRLPQLKYFSPWESLLGSGSNPSHSIATALKSGRAVSLVNAAKSQEHPIHQLAFVPV